MVVPKSWSQYEVQRASGVPDPVVYSYLTEVYRNGSATSLLIGRIVEAEYVVLSDGTFSRAVQYDPVSLFAHEQIRTVWAC